MMVNFCKTAATLWIQIGGALYLGYTQATTTTYTHEEWNCCHNEDTDSCTPKMACEDNSAQQFCDPNFEWLAFMAFAFTTFMSITLNERLTEIRHRGCYCFIKQCP